MIQSVLGDGMHVGPADIIAMTDIVMNNIVMTDSGKMSCGRIPIARAIRNIQRKEQA